ncbi:hypothetical protein [Streptomyces sp. NBC_00470]|uniref:hypothetical protein n=1 Tax=Streptomyces sp. NBC_00470 TaxID=2975753 RepID=UPI002F9173E1
MSALFQLVPSVLALTAVGGTARRFYTQPEDARGRAARLEEEKQSLTGELNQARTSLCRLAGQTIPTLAASSRPDANVAPQQLEGELAQPLSEVVRAVNVALRAVRDEEEARADAQIAEAQREASEDARQVQRRAEAATREAVRGFATELVTGAWQVSQRVSAGMRRHEGDEVYETLVRIDQITQRALRVAQGYKLLAGGRLQRHWPATSLTDVVRAAMGSVDGYQRIEHEESEAVLASRPVANLITTANPTARTASVLTHPEMDLAVPAAELTWRPGPFRRALTALPVTFPVAGAHRARRPHSEGFPR